MNPTPVHSYIGPRDVRAMDAAAVMAIAEKDMSQFARIGIAVDERAVKRLMNNVGLDSLVSPSYTGSIATPLQFLQTFLPGWVRVATTARKIDELIGVMTAGKWEDEEIIQGVLEYTGKAQPYGDYTNIPLSSWISDYERRSIVRFEEGLRVGVLEEMRASAANINSMAEKREAAQIALDIQRNSVGFLGYNSGNNRTYGFLNDPGLPGYVTVAATGTGATTTWSTKTFLNITADLRAMYAAIRTQSGDQIDPMNTPITLALPTNRVDYLSVTSDYGNSVWDWIKDNYPKTRIVSAPELNTANGGATAAYMYAESIQDGSSDGGRVFVQIVPAKVRLIGTEKQAKALIEDYSNALAGIMVKRPYGVYRVTGI